MRTQKNNLVKMMKVWKEIQTKHKDLIVLGDINLCASRWEDRNYERKELCDLMKRHMMESGMVQLMNQTTRSGVNCKNERVETIIDHIYSSCPAKVKEIKVVEMTRSDHMLIQMTKMDSEVKEVPKMMRRRVYKRMIKEEFMREVLNSGVIHAVLRTDDVDEAATRLEEHIKPIYDKHAPFRNIQIRKNYAPFISIKTKLLLTRKKELLKQIRGRDSRENRKELRGLGK